MEGLRVPLTPWCSPCPCRRNPLQLLLPEHHHGLQMQSVLFLQLHRIGNLLGFICKACHTGALWRGQHGRLLHPRQPGGRLPRGRQRLCGGGRLR